MYLIFHFSFILEEWQLTGCSCVNSQYELFEFSASQNEIYRCFKPDVIWTYGCRSRKKNNIELMVQCTYVSKISLGNVTAQIQSLHKDFPQEPPFQKKKTSVVSITPSLRNSAICFVKQGCCWMWKRQRWSYLLLTRKHHRKMCRDIWPLLKKIETYASIRKESRKVEDQQSNGQCFVANTRCIGVYVTSPKAISSESPETNACL